MDHRHHAPLGRSQQETDPVAPRPQRWWDATRLSQVDRQAIFPAGRQRVWRRGNPRPLATIVESQAIHPARAKRPEQTAAEGQFAAV